MKAPKHSVTYRGSSDEGDSNRNMFGEAVLPSAVMRNLSEEEMQHYRTPFSTPDDRQPTLNWPRQIPIEGEPADVTEIVQAYADWIPNSELPTLFVNADPGAILTGPQREWVRTWPDLTEVTVKGSHFIQEDSPHEIGEAIASWLATID